MGVDGFDGEGVVSEGAGFGSSGADLRAGFSGVDGFLGADFLGTAFLGLAGVAGLDFDRFLAGVLARFGVADFLGLLAGVAFFGVGFDSAAVAVVADFLVRAAGTSAAGF